MKTMTMPSNVEVDGKCCGHVSNGRGNHLREVYGRYSAAKAQAWEQCESLCAELGGFNLCITSANNFVFTAQFEFGNPENGRPMVCHITPTRIYAMYLDMQHIEKAHFGWEEYVRKETSASHIARDYISDDGKCRVVWLCHWAYIVIGGEVYRVANPFRRDGGLRNRVELRRVGSVDDAVIKSVMVNDSHQAVCCSVLPCLVHVAGEHSRCIVYVQHYAKDMPSNHYGRWDAIMVDRYGLAHTIAMCVDACMMMHGHDASGMRVRLMD